MRFKKPKQQDAREGQTTLKPFEEKQERVERMAGAQEKMFKEMGLHEDLKLGRRTLEIACERAEKEREGGEFNKKAAEIYTQFFVIMNGYGAWWDRSPELNKRMLELLEEKGGD